MKTVFEGRFPRDYTCEGTNISPPLELAPAQGAKSYAIVVEDPDAPGKTFVHWVIYNIPATTTRIPKGVPKLKVVQGLGSQGVNDFGEIGYDGPCPPRGHGDHRYFFKAYALSEETEFPPGLTSSQLRQKIKGLTIAQAELVAKYSRS